MSRSIHSDQRLTGDLEGRHAAPDTVDSVRGHPACDVDDALQRVVLRLRKVREGLIDGSHGRTDMNTLSLSG